MDIDNIKNANKGTKAVTLSILGVAVLLLVLVASYGYTSIDKLPVEPLDAEASTAQLKLKYTDCANDDVSTCDNVTAELSPGDSVTKVFSISNVGTIDVKYDIYFRELSSTFVNDELVYKLEDLTTNQVVVDDTAVLNGTNDGVALKNSLVAKVGTTVRYRLTITYLNKDYNQIANRDAEFNIKIGVRENTPSATDRIIASSNGVKSSGFEVAAETDEGVYEMEDDYGTSYYYRGAVENNYVKFAGFYWRIIRINGDGSLRILYDGTQAYANGVSDEGRVALTSIAYHPNYNDAKYVGYMFGGASGTASTSKAQAQTNQTDSNIKTKVDEWYKTNIADKGYGSAVADAIFCNDRSTPGKDVTGWSGDTGNGFGSNATAYGAIGRLHKGISSSAVPAPSFKCPQKNDAFTVNDTEKGNGALTYPVGLITADEIVAAGSGKYGTTNNNYYLRKGTWYWSLSPNYMSSNGNAYVFGVNSNGDLNDYYVGGGGAVVPVINLSAEYAQTLKGTGTMSDPYQAA